MYLPFTSQLCTTLKFQFCDCDVTKVEKLKRHVEFLKKQKQKSLFLMQKKQGLQDLVEMLLIPF